jgi:hypothetical protein
MTTVTEDGGRENIYAVEPQMYFKETPMSHNTKAELLNGRLAMLGFVIAVGTYITTGQIIPGVL